MKREFIIPVTVSAFTKEEAQSQVNLLIQMGAFLKDFNVQNLAGSLAEHFLLSKFSQFTQGRVDLSACFRSRAEPKAIPNSVLKRKRKQFIGGQN
jgi:hypothetical protein